MCIIFQALQWNLLTECLSCCVIVAYGNYYMPYGGGKVGYGGRGFGYGGGGNLGGSFGRLFSLLLLCK